MMAEAKGAKSAYIDAKHVAKHAVWLAKSEAEKEEFTTVSPDGDGVFHIAKQMDCRNQDIVGENCVRNCAMTPVHTKCMCMCVRHPCHPNQEKLNANSLTYVVHRRDTL